MDAYARTGSMNGSLRWRTEESENGSWGAAIGIGIEVTAQRWKEWRVRKERGGRVGQGAKPVEYGGRRQSLRTDNAVASRRGRTPRHVIS